jgi:hypothetical protein
MKRCSYCGRENTEAASYCIECGTALTEPPAAPIPAIPEESTDSAYDFSPLPTADHGQAWATLMTCRTLAAADLVVSKLEAAGIAAFLPDEFLLQAIGWNLNTYGYVRVQVAPKDYEAAVALLSDKEQTV